jgi:hypothetical protein
LTSHHPAPPDEKGRVVPFRGRGVPRWRWPVRPTGNVDHSEEPLAKFERSEGPEDYRHRMLMNGLAFGATTLLIVIGVWLANTIMEMRVDQDCYLSGRRNCAPINTPPVERY